MQKGECPALDSQTGPKYQTRRNTSGGRPTGMRSGIAFSGIGLLVRLLVIVIAACFILGIVSFYAILSGNECGDHERQALNEDHGERQRISEIIGLEVISIRLTQRTDTFEWDKRVCSAVVDTPDGRFTSWI